MDFIYLFNFILQLTNIFDLYLLSLIEMCHFCKNENYGKLQVQIEH